MPWLSGIKFSSGPDVQLINISSTGVLVESGSRFAPGSTTELHLSGPETNLVIPVRFIRSAVARTDELGVRLRGRRVCESADLAGPRRTDAPAIPPQELASLLESVFATATERSEPAHARSADGLRRLPVGARDVKVRTGSAGSSGGLETRTSTCLETIGCARHCRSCSTAITRSPTLNSRCSKPPRGSPPPSSSSRSPSAQRLERATPMALLTERVA